MAKYDTDARRQIKKKWDLSLRPIHYALVSGGKDSLYMLGFILSHPDKYPLDMVVHYQLEIDWEWAERVVDKMESMCNKAGIKFVRIKPRKSWQELYEKYNFPSRVVRWCNSHYKLDCEAQIHEWVRSQGCRPVEYIGLCADEKKRFKYEIGNWKEQIICYPLAEEGIEESTILEWARNNPIFENWYKYMTRQGCKFCPMIQLKELAYMYKYDRKSFEQYGAYVRKYEKDLSRPFFHEYWDVIENRVKTKWLPILENEERNNSNANIRK